jgi:hypothetical protein
MKKSIAVLAGVIGLTTSAAAGNSGLSPIVMQAVHAGTRGQKARPDPVIFLLFLAFDN